MIKLRYIILIILAGKLFYGCVPAKPAYSEKDFPADRLIKKIEAKRRKVKTFSGSGALNIESPKLDAKASFEIEIKRPDSIKLSVYGPFGIDLARALVTKSYFKFYDALNNRLYMGENNKGALKKIFKVDLSFDNLVDAFAGSVNLTDKLSALPDDYSFSDDSYILKYSDGGNKESVFTIDPDNLNVEQYELFDGGEKALSAEYGQFRNFGEINIPMMISLQNYLMNQKLKIEYRNIKVNPDIEQMKLNFPNDAKIINW